MTYDELTKALLLFGLSERTALAEISAYFTAGFAYVQSTARKSRQEEQQP